MKMRRLTVESDRLPIDWDKVLEWTAPLREDALVHVDVRNADGLLEGTVLATEGSDLSYEELQAEAYRRAQELLPEEMDDGE